MANNVGVAPPDFTTPVGQVRAILGDTQYTVIEPTPPDTDPTGLGEYQYFSDAEIEALLAASDSLEGAVALAYNSMATAAAVEAKTVKDYDLQISTEKRAENLRMLATQWADKADALSADIFETFETVEACQCTPELAARAVCWRSCRGDLLF